MLMFASGDELHTRHLNRTHMDILAKDRFMSFKRELVLCTLDPLTLLEFR